MWSLPCAVCVELSLLSRAAGLATCASCMVQAQPYFCENLNTGAVDAQQVVQQHYHKLQQQHDMHDGGSSSSCNGFSQDSTAARIAAEACASFLKGTAEQRQAAAVEAGPLWFVGLIQKVRRGCGWLAYAM